jgi:hypothetical protein
MTITSEPKPRLDEDTKYRNDGSFPPLFIALVVIGAMLLVFLGVWCALRRVRKQRLGREYREKIAEDPQTPNVQQLLELPGDHIQELDTEGLAELLGSTGRAVELPTGLMGQAVELPADTSGNASCTSIESTASYSSSGKRTR